MTMVQTIPVMWILKTEGEEPVSTDQRGDDTKKPTGT